MTSKKMAVGLTCCYFKHLGWPARQIMTNPILTAIIGAYMDTKLSTRRISGFIRANALNMSDYIKQDYRCFNDFFTRQVKAGARPINTDRDTLISPCDGYMSAFKISSDSEFAIKNSYYNVDGFKSRNWHIQGRYHPVQPIVVRKRPVFMQNTREYCMLYTENFGTVVQIEVGACLVGKIENYRQAGVIHRGEEKGLFRFGGSTIVLLFKEGVLDLPQEIFEQTLHGREKPVIFGSAICKKADH